MTAFGLVVPVYDEAGRIEEFGPQIIDHINHAPQGSEVLFVDDGSSDTSTDLIEALLPSARGAAR